MSQANKSSSRRKLKLLRPLKPPGRRCVGSVSIHRGIATARVLMGCNSLSGLLVRLFAEVMQFISCHTIMCRHLRIAKNFLDVVV